MSTATATKETQSKCQNCLREHKKLIDPCIPAALLGYIVHGREGGICEGHEPITESMAIEMLKNTLNVDQLWDDIAEILDRIEEGYYDHEEEDEL